MRVFESRAIRFAFWTLTAAGVAAAIRQATGRSGSQGGAKAASVERSVIINLPSTQVAEALGAVAISDASSDLGMSGERAGITWNMRLEDYDCKRRTRLVAVFGRGEGGFIADHAVAHLVSTELRNMKALLETGEIATVAGQSEGERSFFGAKITQVATRARRRMDDLAKRQLTEVHA